MNAANAARIELARVWWYTFDRAGSDDRCWIACQEAHDIPKHAREWRSEMVRVQERNEVGKILRFRPCGGWRQSV